MRNRFTAVAALLLLSAAGASACPFGATASRAPIVLADNAATSTATPAAGDPAKKPDSVAFPNSPNGSPASADKGAPVVTDKAACASTGAVKCPDSPPPSSKADTSDTKIATPTTVDASAPK